MSQRSPSWTIDSGVRVAIGGVYISFERTRRLDPSEAPRASSSYGTVPIAAGNGAHDADLLVPVREDEAIWLGLSAMREEIPCAVRVIVRQPIAVDAISAAPAADPLSVTPQNYVVVPPQHAVTGVTAGEGVARQFVRIARSDQDAPCDRLEVIVYAATRRVHVRASTPSVRLHQPSDETVPGSTDRKGLTLQRIAADPHGLDMWRDATPASVSVQFVAPETYADHTGRAAPGPMTEATRYGGWRLP